MDDKTVAKVAREKKLAAKVRRKRTAGGRPKGAVGKRTEYLQDLLANKEFNPAVKLMEVFQVAMEGFKEGKGDGPQVDLSHNYLEIARKAASDLMPYVYPKRKAIELSAAEGSENTLTDLIKAIVAKPVDNEGEG